MSGAALSLGRLLCWVGLLAALGCVDTSDPEQSSSGGRAEGGVGAKGGSAMGGSSEAGATPMGATELGGTAGEGPDLSGLPNQLTVASYNVQNLFDLVNDPDRNEYEYTPGGAWNQAAFVARVEHIARVVQEINADVLTLQEVETEEALEALAEQLRAQGGPDYPYLAVSSTNDLRGIRLAVMSKVPFDRAIGRPINAEHTCANGTTLDGRQPEARPIYEVSLWGSGDEALLTLLVNHWKSKAADPIPCAVADHHKRAGAQLRGLIEGWLAERPARAVVVLGDMNAWETEASIRDVLGGVVDRTDLRFTPDLYNLWGELGVGQAGVLNNATNSTYYYNDTWRRLDHIMITQPMLDGRGVWQLERFEQVRPAFVMRDGRPYRWDLDAREGYSDHFAIKVTLRLRSDN